MSNLITLLIYLFQKDKSTSNARNNWVNYYCMFITLFFCHAKECYVNL